MVSGFMGTHSPADESGVGTAAFEGITVVTPGDAAPQARLAAKETARYVYLRTGRLPVVAAQLPAHGNAVVFVTDPSHGAESHAIKTTQENDRRIWTISGGSGLGVLYGSYQFAEKLGVRFYLHGDVVPDERLTALPDVNEQGKPLFATRGILPFHDFFEGPDWWNGDDYKAYLSQMAKMRMNFIGLHNYPERQGGYPGPEPTVWIGSPEDMDDQGNVSFSYPGFFANSLRPGWGNVAMKTSQYVGGAAELFEHDAYGPEPQVAFFPWPESPADCNTVFNRTAAMYREAFTLAHGLGIKTCVGTEAPLTIPQRVQDRLKSRGKDPADPAVVRELYEGLFQRLSRAFPVDYYWLWTPEGWTWGGNKPEEWEAVSRDVRAAADALDKLGRPMTLATSGWVLGPQHDRSALDQLLPKESPMSCINQNLGHAPVDRSFERIQGRPKWAIPWLENDVNMTGPQPWVGRMFYDGSDAHRYGCTGLIGIHWRTKSIAMNIAALARAGWSLPESPQTAKPANQTGALNGSVVGFPTAMAGTDESPVYQTVRYDTDGYHLDVPNGIYTITLKLVEPAYAEVGKRVFGIQLQGKTVVDRMDVFGKAGKDRALDLDFPKVKVADGRLKLDFVRIVEFPCIAALVIQGMTDAANQIPSQPFTRKINCGGPAWNDYEADAAASGAGGAGEDRSLGAGAFYQDWAAANFGSAAAQAIAALFTRLDGKAFPETSTWGSGPGMVKANLTPWTQEAGRYAFVDEMEGLRKAVKGAGNLERFDYWLNTFRYTRAMARFGAAVGELHLIMKEPVVDKSRALAVREELARLWVDMIRLQMAAVDTPGELGTIANLEQQSRGGANLVGGHDAALEKILGTSLPPSCTPSTQYEGPARLIVPTVRGIVEPRKPLALKIITLGGQPVKSLVVRVRPLGGESWQEIKVQPVARAIYNVTLPPTDSDFEYHITALTADGHELVWPATAPELNQTVVVWAND